MSAIDEMYEKYEAKKTFIIPFTGQEPIKINKNKPFTAEKQLEIIKLISSNHYLSTIEYDDGSRGFTVEYYKTDKNDSWVCHVVESNFDEALAQLTIELLKLNELDNRAVKEILER